MKNLLATEGFIPHGHCYLWKPGLVWLHGTSDFLIALAYVAISATLAYLVHKTRQEIPFQWMFLAFGLFIVACGSTHLMSIWTLWQPTYWLSGGLKFLTAVASVTTAIALPPLVPKALALIQEAKLSEERRLHLEVANQELATLYEKLKELDQLKTQFFANVSHELRTPLTLILGPTERLLTTGELNEAQCNDLKLIDRNARMLLKQVNDLLDVSKLEAGKMELNYTEVDLAKLVRLTATNFEELAKASQISFTVETPESLPAQVDGEKLNHILLNLLANAFKFTPQGGRIHCALSIQAKEQQSSAEDSSVEAVIAKSVSATISIQDSGPGVPPALRTVIFERFRQGEGGMTRRFGGTGLGLAIVKEFVELHGGTITVDDAAEGGARFTVELPLTAPPNSPVSEKLRDKSDNNSFILPLLQRPSSTEAPAQTQKQANSQDISKPLVLVVEDNPDMNQFITETLASEYRTVSAYDGQQGLEQTIALHPDLIICDVMMPRLSGDELVQQLRTYPKLSGIPIILLTAKTDDELKVQLLRSGAQDYLMKPFSIEELKARVGNLITVKRSRERLQQELASQSQNLEVLVDEISCRKQELQLTLEKLQQQSEELKQANRLKDEFLAIVSHELRTPLNVIFGCAQLLLNRKLNEAKITRVIETIERNARLQIQHVENILDISRLMSGRFILEMRQVDLRTIVQATITDVKPQAQEKAIHIESMLDASTVSVWGAPERLQQIVKNLVTNAIKFTPTGGRVAVYLSYLDNFAQIQISDNGQGINPEFLPYIFDNFRQADSSTTRFHEGLGLGLAITYQLVKLHHGTIQVESAGVDQGATFTVRLPLLGSGGRGGVGI